MTAAANPPRKKYDPQFIVVKYLFMLINMVKIVAAALALYHTQWVPGHSLIILGLIFGIILGFLALLGALKEESYLILTYAIAVALFFVSTFFYANSHSAKMALFFYALFSFYFSLLLYKKAGPTPLI